MTKQLSISLSLNQKRGHFPESLEEEKNLECIFFGVGYFFFFNFILFLNFT